MTSYIKRIVHLHAESIGVFGILLFAVLFQALRCSEYPGLYLDAVNPDYLAVQFLFPQIENPSWTVPHSGIPFLGQLYHGTLTVWLQVLIIGMAGSASVITLRIANTVYLFGICWCIYLICRRIGVHKIITVTGITAMIFSPQVYSFIRTQYYIKLPGVLFLLISLYLLMVYNESREEKALFLIASGGGCGLAFYSYFIYLFYVPAMVILCLHQSSKKHKKTGRDILAWMLGFSCGASLYVIGYFDLLITSSGLHDEIKKVIIYIFTVMLVVFFFYLCAYTVRNYNDYHKLKKMYWIVLFCLFVCGIAMIVNLEYIVSVVTPHLSALNVAGEKMSFGRRIGHFFVLWFHVMTNRYPENLMLGISTSIFPKIYCLVLVILSVAVGVTFVRVRQINLIIKMIGGCWLLICSYFLCSLAFISRMWGQHFTPVFLISYMLIILNTGYLYSVRKKPGKGLAVGLLALMLIIGITNSNILDTNIRIVGGNGFYSAQINKLAETALSKKKSGEKEIYIFPEWGFLCGFNYLTWNQIPIMTEIDEGRLNGLLAEGYDFRLCAWDCEKEAEYRQMLRNAGIEDIETEYTFSNDGSRAFYILYSKKDTGYCSLKSDAIGDYKDEQ